MEACPICKGVLGPDAIRLRYEGRHYVFCSLRCKMTFQENPDRWLDAGGDLLPQPR